MVLSTTVPELFGDRTKLANGELAKNGFAALADLDSNGDGKVDAADQQFSSLRVWRDLNGDGVSSANELFTLEQLGIKTLNTGFSNSNQALNGNNLLVQQGSYVKADGGSGQMGDVNLAFDPCTAAIKTRWRSMTLRKPCRRCKAMVVCANCARPPPCRRPWRAVDPIPAGGHPQTADGSAAAAAAGVGED